MFDDSGEICLEVTVAVRCVGVSRQFFDERAH